MIMYNQINQIPIQSILDKLWIKFRYEGNWILWLIENERFTNGWKLNVRDNYIHDFSWKWRPIGPPFAFVKQYFNLTANETFKRFETNFNIKDELKRPKNKWSPRQKENKVTRPYSRARLND